MLYAEMQETIRCSTYRQLFVSMAREAALLPIAGNIAIRAVAAVCWEGFLATAKTHELYASDMACDNSLITLVLARRMNCEDGGQMVFYKGDKEFEKAEIRYKALPARPVSTALERLQLDAITAMAHANTVLNVLYAHMRSTESDTHAAENTLLDALTLTERYRTMVDAEKI